MTLRYRAALLAGGLTALSVTVLTASPARAGDATVTVDAPAPMVAFGDPVEFTAAFHRDGATPLAGARFAVELLEPGGLPVFGPDISLDYRDGSGWRHLDQSSMTDTDGTVRQAYWIDATPYTSTETSRALRFRLSLPA